MKAWEMMYGGEALEEGKSISGDVKIIQNDGVEIIGEIGGFNVRTYIEYNSPTHAFCNCSKTPCKHEAALIYYLENHPEEFVKDLDLKEKCDMISHDELKKFVLNELENNDDFKIKFLKEFQGDTLIDKNFYNDKLSDIFKRGEDRDFKLHGIYNLDLMESDLDDFLNHDIDDILMAGEYDFACDLLCKIGDLLDDELMSTYDSWYNLSESFMHYVFSLSTSIYLDSDKMEELNSKTGLITDLITVF